MADLHTRYLRMELGSPLVASASPLTGTLDGLRRLEAAGAGAVVLPSLFEEDLAEETREVQGLLATGAIGAQVGAGHPEQAGYGAGPAAYLSLLEQAKASLSIPVIASLNGVSRTGWVRYAARLEQAGADALELNIYYVSRGPASAAGRSSGTTWTWSGRCGRPSASRWRSSSAPTSARWSTSPGSWPRPALTGWCCSTGSTSPTWTSRRSRWCLPWS